MTCLYRYVYDNPIVVPVGLGLAKRTWPIGVTHVDTNLYGGVETVERVAGKYHTEVKPKKVHRGT